MIIRKMKDNTLRLNHEIEVNGHKIDEAQSVQVEQDEAIAAVLEMLLEFFAEAEEGEEIEILSRDDVTTLCEQIIEKKVKNSVAAKVAADLKKAIPEIVAQVVEEIGKAQAEEETPNDEEAAQDDENKPQEDAEGEPEEIIDESENAPQDDAQSVSDGDDEDQEVSDDE